MIKNITIQYTKDGLSRNIDVSDKELEQSIAAYVEKHEEAEISDAEEDLSPYIPGYITDVRDHINNEYNSEITLDTLEGKFGVSRYKICRDFSKAFGFSPIKYLNKVRIGRAAQLLLSTELRIHEIGTMVGIDNTNNFINLFKKETGETPLSWREKNCSSHHIPTD